MNAELIAVGTELLLGTVLNDDTAYLGRTLAELGIHCYHHVTVGDNPERLEAALRTALARADLVITCGGLGPTVDDITLETIAGMSNQPLVLNRKILQQIQDRFRQRKIRMPQSNVRQAMLPKGAIPFPNRIGTAPGFLLTLSHISGQTFAHPRILVALPGPPWELMPMVQAQLIRRLRRFSGKTILHSKTVKITGITESEVDQKVRDLLRLNGATTVGIYSRPGEVKLRITAKASSCPAAKRQIAPIERKIRKRFGNHIFGVDEETLEAVVGKLLKARGWTLGVAESCTGGLVQHRITNLPGSSRFFLGGIIAYANRLKNCSLSVPASLLNRTGAVSAPVAKAMAQGVRTLTGAKLGLSLTGIAGPTGGTKQKPVGLVYLGLSTSHGVRTFRFQFPGDRETVKFRASQAALDLVRKFCLEKRK